VERKVTEEIMAANIQRLMKTINPQRSSMNKKQESTRNKENYTKVHYNQIAQN
jgi:histone H3/H4